MIRKRSWLLCLQASLWSQSDPLAMTQGGKCSHHVMEVYILCIYIYIYSKGVSLLILFPLTFSDIGGRLLSRSVDWLDGFYVNSLTLQKKNFRNSKSRVS